MRLPSFQPGPRRSSPGRLLASSSVSITRRHARSAAASRSSPRTSVRRARVAALAAQRSSDSLDPDLHAVFGHRCARLQIAAGPLESGVERHLVDRRGHDRSRHGGSHHGRRESIQCIPYPPPSTLAVARSVMRSTSSAPLGGHRGARGGGDESDSVFLRPGGSNSDHSPKRGASRKRGAGFRRPRPPDRTPLSRS